MSKDKGVPSQREKPSGKPAKPVKLSAATVGSAKPKASRRASPQPSRDPVPIAKASTAMSASDGPASPSSQGATGGQPVQVSGRGLWVVIIVIVLLILWAIASK